MSYQKTPIELLDYYVTNLLLTQKRKRCSYEPVINEIFNNSFTENFNIAYCRGQGESNIKIHSVKLNNGKEHIIISVRFGRNVFSFDPNGKHRIGYEFSMLNTINLHKANEIKMGECQLWGIAAAVEIAQEPNEQSLIANSESKELIKRIAARFINLKQTMLDINKFISLGEKIDNSVEKFLEEGKRFIRPEGFTELMDGQKQILQIKSTPQITTSTRSTSNRAATNLILSHPSNRQYPQALKSSSSDEQLTHTPQQQNNNLKKVNSFPNLKDKLAVFRQDRIITPKQHTKQSHKRTKSAPNIGV